MKILLYTLACVIWVSGLVYHIAAWQNPELPISWGSYLMFTFSSAAFLIPAILISIPKSSLSNSRIFFYMWLIMIGVHWIFSPLYVFLTLNAFDRESILSLTLNYGWEIPAIATIYAVWMYRIFKKILRGLPAIKAQAKLMLFPARAAFILIFVTIIAVSVGVVIARMAIEAPWLEISKVWIATVTMGAFGGLLIYFVLDRLIKPWLEQPSA